MARLTIKVAVNVPRKVSNEGGDWREIVMEQLTEQIPESVFYTTEDGEEFEMDCEVVE
jgi:hypothetical protein